MGAGAAPLTMATSMTTATAAVGAASASAAIAGAATATTAVATSPIWAPVVTGAAVFAAVAAVALHFCSSHVRPRTPCMVRAHRQTLFQEFTPKEPTACHLPILPKAGRGLVFTSTFVLCGRRGTYGIGLALVARLVPICRHGRGRRGIWKHRPPFCVAGVVLGASVLAQLSLATTWHTTISHTTLSHTTLSHNSFTYNSLTHSSFTQSLSHHIHATHTLLNYPLSHTQLADTQPSHKQLSRNFLIRTSFTQSAFHRLHRTHTYFTFSYAYYKPSHTQPSYTELSHSICSTISFLLPAFPIPSSPFFCYLLEEIDMWGYLVL